MDAKNDERTAAIRFATPHGLVFNRIPIRHDGADVADFQMLHGCAQSHDFGSDFMSQNSRISEKRLLAIVGMKVSAADAAFSTKPHRRQAIRARLFVSFSRRPVVLKG